MKKSILSLMLILAMVASFLPAIPVMAVDESVIPTDGLDLWLEADSGVQTDANGDLISWTSKANDGAIVLDTLNSATETGWLKPHLKTSSDLYGNKAVYFKGKSIYSSVFDPLYKGQMSAIILTKTIGYDTDSYFLQTGHSDATKGIIDRGFKFLRVKAGGISLSSNIGGTNLGNKTANYTILSAVAKDSANLDTDGTALKSINTWQDGTRITSGFNTNTTNRIGFDTISKYTLGHRADEEIAAVFVYKKALTDVERTAIEQYIKGKYLTAPPQPIVSSAVANESGNSISVGFNMPLAGTADNFSVKVTGGSAINVTSATIDTDKTKVELALATPLIYGQAATVSYSGTGLTNADGTGFANAFTDYAVDVSAIPQPVADPPVVIKSVGSIKGNKIVLTTNLDITGTATVSDFAVAGETSGSLPIKSVAIAGKNITITLTTPFAYKENVTVSYTGNTILGTNSTAVAPFANQNVVQYTFENIPTTDLDLWLEADSGVVTDASGYVSSWTSKVNSDKRALNILNSVQETGWLKPQLITSSEINGKNSISFVGKSIRTADFTDVYKGPTSFIMVMKTNVNHTNPPSYVLQTGSTGALKLLQLNSSYNLMSDVGGTSIATGYGKYTMLTATAQDRISGTDVYKTINAWQDGVKKTTDFNTDGTSRVGFDTISKYELGHRSNEEIAAVMVYHRAIDELEREAVEQYLYEKYMMDNKFEMNNLSYSFENASGEASDVPVAGGKLKITGSFVNMSVNMQPSATIIATDFNGDFMKDISTQSFQNCGLGNANDFEVTLNLPDDISATNVRLMVWDNIDNIKPLRECIAQPLSALLNN